MKIPKQITIFKHIIKITDIDVLEDKFGEFDPATNTIKLAKHITSNNIKTELSNIQRLHTFWHEVFHAFQWFYEGEYNESQSQVYAGFILEILNDIEK